MKPVSRSRENPDEWCTNDGMILGKGTFVNGYVVLKHPETGEEIRVVTGIMKDGNFLEACTNIRCIKCNVNKQIVACRKEYSDEWNFYANIPD